LQQDSLTETDSSKQEMIEHQSDIARIVECASLLHDIGNPPYGHFGEDIIRQWFKKNLPHITTLCCLFILLILIYLLA